MSLFAQLYAARWMLGLIALAAYAARAYLGYRRLRAFAGPPTTGWSELIHIRAFLGRRSHLWYREVGERYGPIARVGPNDLITSSPDLLAHMNAVRSPYTRSTWFNAATRTEVGRDHVFSQIDEAQHTKRRQQMASGYSGKENLSLESDIDEHVQQLLDLIRSKYLSTSTRYTPMDLGSKIQYFTLDVISKIGFGKAFGDLKADADVDNYISSGRDGLAIIIVVAGLGLTPYLHWPPIARILGPSEKDATGFGKMMAVARGLIDSRLEKPINGRSDMLASFIRHGLNRDDLLTESMLQILAGSDTTATAIRATMLYLMTHLRVYKILQAEIDATVASSQASTTFDIVSDETLKGLPYLQAVVREGLRMHPPITDVVPKKVPVGGDKFVIEGKEYFFPGGTNISYNAWGLHHDKKIFGEDADCFRPERWLLDDDDETHRGSLNAMLRTSEMVFGYGKYQCLGKPIAWLEIRKAIFEFLRHFDWSLADSEKPWRSLNYGGIFLQDQMNVLVTERKSSLR